MRRWPYVALTAVVAVAVAIWALPHLDDHDVVIDGSSGPRTGPGLPSLSLDTVVTPDAAKVMLLAAAVTLLVQIYSTAYMGSDRRYRSYALLIVLFLAAMVAVVATDNLFVLLIGWEVMGVCSYLLIGHWWEQPQSRAGAMKALIVTRFGDLGLLVAIIVIGQTYGTYSVTGAWAGAAEHAQHETAVGLLVLLAVVGKSAQVPLQTWLPDAMPGPTPITALIHAATMVAAGVYVFARLLPLYGNDTTVMTALAVVAGVTMLLAALFALVQHDLKRALAWSTVSQLAYMFAAIAAGTADVGVSHLVSHGAYKALLFLGCGVVMHAVGTSALSAMGGLRTTLPVTFWTMTIGFAALAGIIPTVGFFTKDHVLQSIHFATSGVTALPGGVAWALLVVAYVTVFLTAAYAMRLWMLTFLGPVRHPRPGTPAGLPAKQHVEPRAMTWPLLALGAACLALSIGEPLDLDTAAWSTVVALAGIAFAWWRQDADLPGPVQRPLVAELGLDHPITRLVPGGTIGVARVADVIDREGIDVYPRGGAVLADVVSSVVRALQSGRVQVYASAIAVGALAVVLVGVVAR